MSDASETKADTLPLTRRDALAGATALAGSLLAAPLGAEAGAAAAEAQPPVDPLIRQPGRLGKAVSRRDGPQKVRGEAQFAAEYRFDGMTYAALVYSTIARGTITSIDTSRAAKAPGVVLVMTHENAPRMHPPEVFLASASGASGSGHPVMQDAEVHWNGQPIAVVLADTQEQADHAASLVAATYREAPAVALRRGEARRHADRELRRRGVAVRARRRRRGAGGVTRVGRPRLYDAPPQPQSDRASRGDARLGGRQAPRP
jgi:hypothetical protein